MQTGPPIPTPARILPSLTLRVSRFVGFSSATDGVLGHYGIDTGSDTVWAVLNHNSQFAVAVPEPSTLMLLAAGLLGVLVFASRKRR